MWGNEISDTSNPLKVALPGLQNANPQIVDQTDDNFTGLQDGYPVSIYAINRDALLTAPFMNGFLQGHIYYLVCTFTATITFVNYANNVESLTLHSPDGVCGWGALLCVSGGGRYTGTDDGIAQSVSVPMFKRLSSGGGGGGGFSLPMLSKGQILAYIGDGDGPAEPVILQAGPGLSLEYETIDGQKTIVLNATNGQGLPSAAATVNIGAVTGVDPNLVTAVLTKKSDGSRSTRNLSDGLTFTFYLLVIRDYILTFETPDLINQYSRIINIDSPVTIDIPELIFADSIFSESRLGDMLGLITGTSDLEITPTWNFLNPLEITDIPLGGYHGRGMTFCNGYLKRMSADGTTQVWTKYEVRNDALSDVKTFEIDGTETDSMGILMPNNKTACFVHGGYGDMDFYPDVNAPDKIDMFYDAANQNDVLGALLPLNDLLGQELFVCNGVFNAGGGVRMASPYVDKGVTTVFVGDSSSLIGGYNGWVYPARPSYVKGHQISCTIDYPSNRITTTHVTPNPPTWPGADFLCAIPDPQNPRAVYGLWQENGGEWNMYLQHLNLDSGAHEVIAVRSGFNTRLVNSNNASYGMIPLGKGRFIVYTTNTAYLISFVTSETQIQQLGVVLSYNYNYGKQINIDAKGNLWCFDANNDKLRVYLNTNKNINLPMLPMHWSVGV
jgi:hypothetical protein